MGGIDTPAAENNNRIIRKLCSLSDYWGRRKFLKERGLHGDRLNNILGVVCFCYIFSFKASNGLSIIKM